MYTSVNLDSFKSLLAGGAKQLADITVYPLSGETFTLNNANILSGGMTVDRYSISGEHIEIGSAIAAELSLSLRNADGEFDSIKFEGAELVVKVGVSDGDNTYQVPLGRFTVDEPPRKKSIINITALDRMMQFDKGIDWAQVTFPITAENLLDYICIYCNITREPTASNLPNYNYSITAAPTIEVSCRQVLQWLCEIMGVCAFIDWDGKLRTEWYSDTAAATITPSERYSSDMFEDDVTISGVQVADSDDYKYIAGTTQYAFNIEGNALLQHNNQGVADTLFAVLGGFSYRPYVCSCRPVPYIFPLDKIIYTDADGNNHSTIVTNITYTLGGGTSLCGKGETATTNGYAAANNLTQRERIIIDKIRSALNETLNTRTQSLLAFNELISNALGVYSTAVTQNDGSVIYYMHDAAALETSRTIYTMTSDGFAYTNTGWNDGSPVWLYGFANNGNVIVNKVNATGIEVSDVGTKYSAKITPGIFSVWYGAMQVLSVNGDESSFGKVKITEQLEIGKIRIVPHYEGAANTGTDIIFVD